MLAKEVLSQNVAPVRRVPACLAAEYRRRIARVFLLVLGHTGRRAARRETPGLLAPEDAPGDRD